MNSGVAAASSHWWVAATQPALSAASNHAPRIHGAPLLSHHGYVKRMPVDTYRTQSRGGRGVNAQNLKEEDYVKSLM